MKYFYTDSKKNKAVKEDFWEEVGSTFALILFFGLCIVISCL